MKKRWIPVFGLFSKDINNVPDNSLEPLALAFFQGVSTAVTVVGLIMLVAFICSIIDKL